MHDDNTGATASSCQHTHLHQLATGCEQGFMVRHCSNIAGMTGALLSNGTTNLLADRTMASAIGNASRRALARGIPSSVLGLP